MTSKDDVVASHETKAPVVDVVEMLALVAVPAVVFAAAAAVGDQGIVAGFVLGGFIGLLFAGLRRTVVAVRTPDGIERRRRRFDDDPETNPWVRLAAIEYDRCYDLVLAVAFGLLGLAALAAVPLFADDYRVAVRLLGLALFGMVASLGGLGSYYLRRTGGS